MRQQTTYRAFLITLTGIALAGALWLLVTQPKPPGVELRLPTVTPGSFTATEPLPFSAQRLDINTASVAELQTLPGIGPVLAQRIVDHRAANGPFVRPDEVLAVDGIGPATYEGIRGLIAVEE